MPVYEVLKGVLWTKFDEDYGSIPIAWVPHTLSDEILFSVALRGMSVFSSRPTNISYSKMLATIPFPEYELFSVSTVLYESSESRGGFDINLISVLIPQVIMENAWLDLRQIQGIFQKYFGIYEGHPIKNTHKEAVVKELAKSIDDILKRKIQVINEGEKIRDQLYRYLDSYLVTSRTKAEQQLIVTRVQTLIRSLDRVLEAGDHDRIQEALDQMTYILEQGFDDEIIFMYQGAFTQFIQI